MTAPSPACREDVRRTLAYLTAVGYGGTAMEVWQWLYRPSRAWSLEEVMVALDAQVAEAKVDVMQGRYALAGHGARMADRHERYLSSDKKMQSARWFLRVMRLIPGVRAVAVCNSLSHEMASEKSDIDLFVITRSRALWCVRFFALLPLSLLRRRPGHRTRHPICLSFFLSDASLDLRDVHLKPDDPHMAHWLLSTVPMIDDGVFADCIHANAWARELFPNAQSPRVAWYRRLACLRPLSWSLPFWLERVLEQFQLERLPSEIRKRMNGSTDVIINEHMLKFHTNDRRLEYRERFLSLARVQK
ncbi:hypothetical protein A3I45_03420 [Candidatus Uhrbacteria bacterium RIFCSPLOWO2_02_FULL_53_10]|uniref:PI-PLC Y-box domain-containing protein n=1 Tax=Candidatus Uhrbacteria bacterium RIFCSPLOWO2_02_FULL_53_10 TaxID=1802411 RepID=A0A1F7VGU6_9BACT|nr:MAG: hypothetical protein A3I45_03420 [Candidatus Uhrbacteria bacterium RIFCSPLOWO2_02_FULL_53_10]